MTKPRSPESMFRVVLVGLFGVAFTATAFGFISIPMLRSPTTELIAPPEIETGPQLVMLYFGAAHCAWATNEALPAAVRGLQESLRRTAAEEGRSFISIGVAVDWSPWDGADHLRTVADFDEIVAGGKWRNTAGLGFIWELSLGS